MKVFKTVRENKLILQKTARNKHENLMLESFLKSGQATYVLFFHFSKRKK